MSPVTHRRRPFLSVTNAPEEDTGMWCSSEGLEIPSELRSSVLKMFTALLWGLKPWGREGC